MLRLDRVILANLVVVDDRGNAKQTNRDETGGVAGVTSLTMAGAEALPAGSLQQSVGAYEALIAHMMLAAPAEDASELSITSFFIPPR